MTGTLVALKPEEDRVTLLVAEKEVSLSLHEVIRIDPILRTTTSSTATKESAVSFHGAIKLETWDIFGQHRTGDLQLIG